jgi:hypothetical protein
MFTVKSERLLRTVRAEKSFRNSKFRAAWERTKKKSLLSGNGTSSLLEVRMSFYNDSRELKSGFISRQRLDIGEEIRSHSHVRTTLLQYIDGKK